MPRRPSELERKLLQNNWDCCAHEIHSEPSAISCKLPVQCQLLPPSPKPAAKHDFPKLSNWTGWVSGYGGPHACIITRNCRNPSLILFLTT